MPRPALALLLALSLLATADTRANTLDPAFAGSGIGVFTAAGEGTRVFGACPHADGSVSILAARDTPREWVIARVRANGTLDPNFSGDGLATIALGSSIRDTPVQSACVGAGNADPNDDAMVVAASTNVSYLMNRHLLLARFNLQQGTADWSTVQNINATMMGYDPETGETDWVGQQIHGLFPGENGDWLVMGTVNQGSTMQRGFLLRMNAGGGLMAWNAINVYEGLEVHAVHAARIVAPNELRALARVQTTQGQTWALLRLAPDNLSLAGVPAVGGSDTYGYGLGKGRSIAGGGFVVPALAPSNAPFGSTPHLLLVRGNQVSDVALPQSSALGGEATGSSGLLSATVASNGRVIVGMGLVSSSTGAAGFYTAVVKLGDGAAVPDQVDIDYGSNGSDVFRFAPPVAQSLCPGDTAPAQHFANLSSWGNATVLVGNAAPRCYDEANNDFGSSTWVLAARILSDTGVILRDGFE